MNKKGHPETGCTVGIATINVPWQFKITQSDSKGKSIHFCR